MFYHATFIFVIIITYALGFFVLAKNRKKLINFLFFIFDFFAATWLLTLYLFYIVQNESLLLIIGRLNFASVIIFTYFLFLFVYNFPVILFKIKNKYLVFLLIETAFLSFITIFTSLISRAEIFVGDQIITVYGSFYFLFVLHYLIYFSFIIIILIYKYRKLIGLERLQTRYLIWGFAISAIIGSITNILLPLLGIYSWQKVSILCILIPAFTITYAILRYRLMDIRVIIRRSAVFAVLIAAITSIYALFAYLISISFQGLIGTQSVFLNGILTAIFVALGFEPLKNLLSRWTDSFLFKGTYNPQVLLAEITSTISTTLDLKKVLNTINKKLYNAFRATFFSIYLYDDEKKCFSETVFIGKRSNSPKCLSGQEMQNYQLILKKHSPAQNLIVTDEIKKINEIKSSPQLLAIIKELDKNDVSLTLPVFSHDKPIGIFFLGPKKSGDYYSQEDLNVLEIVSSQSATAIENSRLYKEVNDLNQNLQKKVAEQTKDIVDKNKKLERLLKIKSEFLDIASHQLRTPVSVINGILDMFKSGTMDKLPKKKQMTFISNAFSKGQKLNAVINDILDASDLDEKELDLKNSLEELDFTSLVKNIVSYNQPEAEQKKIKISADIAKDIMVKGDKKYLEQAIGNLVDNAVKYTPENKEVSIILSKVDKYAQVKIKDSGIGIPEKEHKLLFQKFSRASNAKELHTDGSGLGLFIVKKVINAHPGAKIWFESKEGQGTTFYVQLLAI